MSAEIPRTAAARFAKDPGRVREVVEMCNEADAQEVGADGFADALLDIAERWAREDAAEARAPLEAEVAALRGIVKRASGMGLCSQTHHEHLMADALRTLTEFPAAATEHDARVGRAAVEAALTEERLAAALRGLQGQRYYPDDWCRHFHAQPPNPCGWCKQDAAALRAALLDAGDAAECTDAGCPWPKPHRHDADGSVHGEVALDAGDAAR